MMTLLKEVNELKLIVGGFLRKSGINPDAVYFEAFFC